MWLEEKQFVELIKNWWDNMREGLAIFRLAIKLKKLKQTIKEWAKCRGGDKALGPDGYPIAFFQCFWDTTKADMAFL